ncbi:MAG: hypothetical protein RLZZ230_425 [Candidatus Parcubacteria bacterium]|jgi:hypothetical protein
MRITILSPLFPPDVGAPAPYAKTLAEKLFAHTITLIVFIHLPEAVPNIKPITIDKRWSKARQLIKALQELIKASRQTDIILVNNGLSTELPVLICSYFIKTPILLCLSDNRAIEASTKGFYHFIHKRLCRRVTATISLPAAETEYLRLEKLPFTNTDNSLITLQSVWWKNHIAEIISYAK